MEFWGRGEQECASPSGLSTSTSVASFASPFPVTVWGWGLHACPWSWLRSQPWPPTRQAGRPHANTGPVLSLPQRGLPAALQAHILAALSPSRAAAQTTGLVLTSPGCLQPSRSGVPSGPGRLPLDWLAPGCPLVVKQVLSWPWRSPARGPPWDMRWMVFTLPPHPHPSLEKKLPWRLPQFLSAALLLGRLSLAPGLPSCPASGNLGPVRPSRGLCGCRLQPDTAGSSGRARCIRSIMKWKMRVWAPERSPEL